MISAEQIAGAINCGLQMDEKPESDFVMNKELKNFQAFSSFQAFFLIQKQQNFQF